MSAIETASKREGKKKRGTKRKRVGVPKMAPHGEAVVDSRR